jgi:hypothetical protein
MKSRIPPLPIITALVILIITACAPKATPPPVDVIGTLAVRLASEMQTQTVAAYSPTPPPPTVTLTPVPTETPTIQPTTSGPPRRPQLATFAACWLGGPGSNYPLDSNIEEKTKVDILGIGSIPGWYIIRNPYFHKPCWIEAVNLKIDPAMDLSQFPVITPEP